MNLFSDEQRAFQKMKSDGLSDDQAFGQIKARRSDLMGGNTQLNPMQSAALMQMQKAGVTAEDAVKRVIGNGEGTQDTRPAWKQAGEAVTNAALGNLSTISKYGGNTLDFLTAGKAWFGDMVKQWDAAIAPEVKNSMAFKAGEYLPWIAASVAPIWNAAAGANAIRQWVTAGTFFGMTNPIVQKWNDASASDVIGWGLLGWLTGAIGWGLASRAASQAELKAADYAEKKASGVINDASSDMLKWAYKDGTELLIPKQDEGISGFAKDVVRKIAGMTPEASDQKMTQIASQALKVPTFWKDARKIMNAPQVAKEWLEELWKVQRSGAVDWTLDTMPEAAQTLMNALDATGKRIGKAVRGNPSAKMSEGAIDDAIASAQSIASSRFQSVSEWPGSSELETFLNDLGTLKSTWSDIEGAFELKQQVGDVLASLTHKGEKGAAVKAISDMYGSLKDGIYKSIDELDPAIAKNLAKDTDTFRKLKQIELQMVKSASVDARQSSLSLPQQMALMQYMDPKTLLTNPIGGAATLGFKVAGDAMKDVTGRSGALGNFFRILDERAVSGKWPEAQNSARVFADTLNLPMSNAEREDGNTIGQAIGTEAPTTSTAVSGTAATISSRLPKAKKPRWSTVKTTDIGE